MSVNRILSFRLPSVQRKKTPVRDDHDLQASSLLLPQRSPRRRNFPEKWNLRRGSPESPTCRMCHTVQQTFTRDFVARVNSLVSTKSKSFVTLETERDTHAGQTLQQIKEKSFDHGGVSEKERASTSASSSCNLTLTTMRFRWYQKIWLIPVGCCGNTLVLWHGRIVTRKSSLVHNFAVNHSTTLVFLPSDSK